MCSQRTGTNGLNLLIEWLKLFQANFPIELIEHKNTVNECWLLDSTNLLDILPLKFNFKFRQYGN